MKTIRLSSNWTLILSVFIPLVWITFFVSFELSSFLANPIEVPRFTNSSFKTGVALFILGGIIFFYFTLFRIKRVDGDGQYIYVSNYFKTYRYNFESIESFVEYDHLIFKACHILLKEKGKFGRRIIFLPKMIHFKIFIKENKLEKLLNPENS